MKKLITVGTAVLFFLTAAPAAAQTFGIGAHAGISVPMGDYADTEVDDAGFATMGFSGGIDLWFPLTMAPGLSWYTSVDAIAHSLDDAAPGASGGYLYFPAMTGLRFDIPVGMVGLYVTGQLGLVFAKPPSVDFGAGEVDGDFSTKFGFNLGAGAQLTDFIYAGLKFYPMGDVEWSWDSDAMTQELPVSFFDVYVGFGVR